MDLIEDKIKTIILESKNIAEELPALLDENQTAYNIPIDVALQNILLAKIAAQNQEEEIWDRLLQIMNPNMLSEDVFNYLLENRIAIISLCHMQLRNEWLELLCEFADEPVYTLAKRYFLQETYSTSDFIRFYNNHLVEMNEVSLHLLDIYKNANKRRLLLDLCLNDSRFIDKEVIGWHVLADYIQTVEDGKEIEDVYHKYSNNGIVLLGISNNKSTPEEILKKLSNVKGVAYAGFIRKNSKESLKYKYRK